MIVRRAKYALGSLLVAAVLAGGVAGNALGRKDSQSSADVAVDLPREARETYRLIREGGPFPYAKDGTVFGNYERRLPRRERGYYREYTVRTPGERSRGGRRIVCGGQQRLADECFYTEDHYNSFKRIQKQ